MHERLGRCVHQRANLIDELWRNTARNLITRSEDNVRGVASSGEASEVDGHRNQSRQSTVRVQQQVRGVAEQNHDKKTKQDRNTVRLDCDSDASTPCGDVKRKQVGSENGSEDTEGCSKDPNSVEILQSNSVESEPLCEMAEWTSIPQPLVVDSGAAETVA